MEVSILIVSRNRKAELQQTLLILEQSIDKSKHEIRVFLDGCTDGSENLKKHFSWVHWESVTKSMGASKARSILYKKAKGNFFIGFDDDAHPLHSDFIDRIKQVFRANKNTGVIAFKEVRGVFKSDKEALKTIVTSQEYLCTEFVGCGFAIKKEVYQATNGFPVWVDIYGEEACVSIEVLNEGFDILFTTNIAVNHRVDKNIRKQEGNNYYRFGRQLKNSAFYFLVYHGYPLKRVFKLFYHNFKKYATKDFVFFKNYLISSIIVFIKLPYIIIYYRNPIKKSVLAQKKRLPFPGRNTMPD